MYSSTICAPFIHRFFSFSIMFNGFNRAKYMYYYDTRMVVECNTMHVWNIQRKWIHKQQLNGIMAQNHWKHVCPIFLFFHSFVHIHLCISASERWFSCSFFGFSLRFLRMFVLLIVFHWFVYLLYSSVCFGLSIQFYIWVILSCRQGQMFKIGTQWNINKTKMPEIHSDLRVQCRWIDLKASPTSFYFSSSSSPLHTCSNLIEIETVSVHFKFHSFTSGFYWILIQFYYFFLFCFPCDRIHSFTFPSGGGVSFFWPELMRSLFSIGRIVHRNHIENEIMT